MSKTHMNEILISYEITDTLCHVSYTVTDSKNNVLQQQERDWVHYWGTPHSAMSEWNMAIDVLMSLDINDLNKVEIERSMSTLGNRLIWVRY